MAIHRFGAFGHGQVDVDERGFAEVPVLVKCFRGASPSEICTDSVLQVGEDEFNRQWTALQNRSASTSPYGPAEYFLATARIKVFRDEAPQPEEGFTDIPAIVQESGLFAGAPPAPLRIVQFLPFDTETNRQAVRDRNKHADLPYYLVTARIKFTSIPEKITDEILVSQGVEVLKEDK